MNDVNPVTLSVIAKKLDALGFNYAFVGGSIVAFLLDDPNLSPIRPTDDVDVILEVMTSVRYSDIEEKLRHAGFTHDVGPNAPMCRWLMGNITVDIMPTKQGGLGLNTQWFHEALETSTLMTIERFQLRIITPVAFLATKLVAFTDRGNNDYYTSHDLEDILTVIDGRKAIASEIDTSAEPLRSFIIKNFLKLQNMSDFREALPGHLPSDSASQKRLPLLRHKIVEISRLKIA